ncbi:primosomal protein N' [Marinilabiliaceae bacterium JC017]|nr:primosomal protein N' [Marinilabiliaceae bacterium JC017]
MKQLFADIILPVPLPQLFTYEVEEEYGGMIAVGKRVVVPFGRKKLYSGIVHRVHEEKPTAYETKPIVSVLDSEPVVNRNQIRFWEWLADYYQCTLGEVLKAALPSGLKLESETRIIYNDEFEADRALSSRVSRVLDIIAAKKMCTIQEVNQISGLNNCLPILKQLLEYEAIFINERLKESYRAKTEKIVTLAPEMGNEPILEGVFKKLERAPKQLALLMAFIVECGGLNKAIEGGSVRRIHLLKKASSTGGVLKELLNKGILSQSEVEIGRLDLAPTDIQEIKALTAEQQSAIGAIQKQFTEKEVVLLHGVTSSGKTEIYIHLIEACLKKGQQVLYLLPEIALTTQITNRLKKHFGNQLGIYHSKFSDAERVEVWNNLLKGDGYKVIIGVRSSVFLPFSNLGLIVVDEEHENSYKQFDPAPRYHARDAAVVLARFHKAKTLLGTATPSIESYYNAQHGKYGLVELLTRYEGIKMPQIIAVNTREAYRKKQMKSHFSPVLLNHMEEAFARNEQVILFQNRRGFAPFVECNQCAWVPKCKHCDVSMTYHKHLNQLVCHYCNYSLSLPERCPACGTPGLETKGFGTEKIEEEIKQIFPEQKVARMDLDTTRSKKAYEKLIFQYEQKEIDILIGTQMISKGLDFENVSLVGILNADNMLNYPDFRAFERSFQLMAQVSGRAGRKNKQGLVILQTSNPNHPVIIDVINNNFLNNFTTQIEERELFKYPPFYRLINISIKHKDAQKTNKAAYLLGEQLRHLLGNRVLGPQAPPVGRIQNLFIKKIMLKVERRASSAKVKQLVREVIFSLTAQQEFRSVLFQIDVDPM